MRVALLGPIKHWWSCWDSPEHQQYVQWRELVNDSLVGAGHLVYRPHEAWKGEWEGNDGELFAQAVNDAAILASQVLVNLTPPGVPSLGTDGEMDLCKVHEKVVLHEPPGDLKDLARLVATLRVLNGRL